MKKKSICILTTNFGFGPVSKALYIAEELRRRSSNKYRLIFVGDGISCDYARKNSVFDGIVNLPNDTDFERLAAHLANYNVTVNVLNFDVLPYCGKIKSRMLLVDSLGWMWKAPPPGLKNVRKYYLQNYLLEMNKIPDYSSCAEVRIVPPITVGRMAPRAKENVLLVNYSGAWNPYAPPPFFERYAEGLTKAILELCPAKYEKIVFTMNSVLAAHLSQHFADYSQTASFVHLGHQKFIGLLQRARTILTTPGITTTLEMLSLGVDFSFLVPQNYSQALMSQKYWTKNRFRKCMPLGSFDKNFKIREDVPEPQGVKMVTAALDDILSRRLGQLKNGIQGLLESVSPPLRDLIKIGRGAGQRAIACDVISILNGG